MRFRLLQITTGIVLGLAVTAVVFILSPPDREPARWDALEVVPDPYPAPPLRLTDTRSRPVTLDSFRDDVTLVFFGFTNCPDVCPITMLNWTRALSLLEAEGLHFQGVLVSIDPGRDTPEVLDRYMANFHPSIVALTGTRDEIAATADAWGVLALVHEPSVAADSGAASDPHAGHGTEDAGDTPRGPGDALPERSDPEGYGVDHSSRTFVVDRRGQVVRTLAPFLDAESIVAALRPILREE